MLIRHPYCSTELEVDGMKMLWSPHGARAVRHRPKTRDLLLAHSRSHLLDAEACHLEKKP